MSPKRSKNLTSHLIQRLRTLLSARGPLSALEAYSALGISQSSFSRLIEEMGEDLLPLGKARKTRYALRRRIARLDAVISVYRVLDTGKVRPFAELLPLEPRGFYLRSKEKALEDAVFEDLPYFLDDLRPSGFLGRLIPRIHPELEAPADILRWSSEDCLRYWTQHGSALTGNLILGENALRSFLEKMDSLSESCSYSERAKNVLENGDPGSSAGGEQPKFLVDAKGRYPAFLVKFSPPLVDEPARRIGDLLICEHLAHEVLRAQGLVSARSRVVLEKNRIFLEVERFDRVGLAGRRGMVSLRAVSMEFVGSLESWSEIASGLLKQKRISSQVWDEVRLIESFGSLIANSDMHAGNLSFFVTESLELEGLTPVYDMLPMLYYPRQHQLVEREFLPRTPLPETADVWQKACKMAVSFWKKVAADRRISSGFRKIANQNRMLLEKLDGKVGERFSIG